MTERKPRCYRCRAWRESVKAGKVLSYSQDRFRTPMTIDCPVLGTPTQKMSFCSKFEPIVKGRTCQTCTHITMDDRARLYRHAECIVTNDYVSIDANRDKCPYYEDKEYD